MIIFESLHNTLHLHSPAELAFFESVLAFARTFFPANVIISLLRYIYVRKVG